MLALLFACQDSPPVAPTVSEGPPTDGRPEPAGPRFPFDTGPPETGTPGLAGPLFPPQPPPVNQATANAAVSGQWSGAFSWPIVAVHLHLLPNGRVLSWGHVGTPQIWNVQTKTFQTASSPSLLFCAGHDMMADGRLFVAGGHVRNGVGLPNVNAFDYRSASWTRLPRMRAGRWYPTSLTLANGEVVTVAGTDSSGAVVRTPEVWTGSGFRLLSTAQLALPYYPRMFVAPDSRVFYAGEEPTSRWLNTAGTGSWTTGPRTVANIVRDYGAAVMYEAGKILLVGGGDPPTRTAETIDLNAGAVWRSTGSMATARRHLNATLLPDGTVLVTGGTSARGFNTASGAVLTAELWNPSTGSWTTVASNAVPRMYHATTLLLPDGRVLHTGSGDAGGAVDQRSAELYSPPYLFKGAGPSVTAAPSSIGYGQSFFVQTPDGPSVSRARFIRLGSTTHAFNAGQLLVNTTFGRTTGGLTVLAPSTRAKAPPGYYMLFLLNATGVPSVARIINLR
jgi:hypothetical protein